ncbi:cytochrome P450 [Frankia sp. AgKG'84/4]|uniref:cytochrome P450 n=1 Tax=Frankia sp. AgKG'84/4 TaxID=573490 RepID=UPI00200E7147|nr:cytochrome P450 [Frankia sp. AgKG'84/4]MCL9795135.1 cytochrome P450 [Frankia sp. AgKG'84/4]
MTADIYYDPYDTEIDAAPHELWRRMRDEAPVYRNDRYDFWALSRHADVDAASRNTKTYSSARGTTLELLSGGGASTGMIIFMDPPEHGRLRALVSRAFTPRRIGLLHEQIRQQCVDLLDPYVGSGGFDFVADFGAELPSRVISALLGVPAVDQPRILNIINTMFHIEPGVGMMNDTAINAMFELHAYLTEQLDERRAHPRDDMLTDLVRAEIDEADGTKRRLTDEESANFGVLLVSAGTETVARLLGWASVALAAFPDQRQILVDDPSAIPNGVEELLRYEAPSPAQGRWTTRELTLHGVTIPAESKVLLLTGSAGRDERAFANPDVLDVRRRLESHVSFGLGAHYCLGAPLARLEGRIALEEALRRFPTWEVDHDKAERLHTSTVRGYKKVPITF